MDAQTAARFDGRLGAGPVGRLATAFTILDLGVNTGKIASSRSGPYLWYNSITVSDQGYGLGVRLGLG